MYAAYLKGTLYQVLGNPIVVNDYCERSKGNVMNARRSLSSVVINQSNKDNNYQHLSALGRQDIGGVLHKKIDTSRKENDKCSLTLSDVYVDLSHPSPLAHGTVQWFLRGTSKP